ncbi:MAG: metalloprotease PmbA [Parashewanella sp.]
MNSKKRTVVTSKSIETEQIELQNAVTMALDYAKTLGTSAAEMAISKQHGLSVATRQKQVETVEFNKDGALGITVYRNGCKGSSSTSDLSAEAIKQAVKAADSIAKLTSEDTFNGLADKELMATELPDLQLYHPQELEPEQLVTMAIEAETGLLDFGGAIKASDGASVNAHTGIRVYGNSHGFIGSTNSSRYSLSCVGIGEDSKGMQRDYEYTVARRFSDLESASTIGQKAAKKTVSRLGAKKIATTKLPVILSPEIATGLIGHFVGAISGSSLYRKSTFLLDSLGTQVFPEWFSIHEQPHLIGGLASANFDSEGVATTERHIVDNGILSSYLMTSYSARKLNMQTTGHAGGIYNWTLSHTGQTFDELVKQMSTGLIVTEVMGQGVNPVTGDYSRGAAGFYVENGIIQYPVEEITIAGNLKEMYSSIQAVAKDRDMRSSIRTGAILLDALQIAGN